jgi:hypothetical protein
MLGAAANGVVHDMGTFRQPDVHVVMGQSIRQRCCGDDRAVGALASRAWRRTFENLLPQGRPEAIGGDQDRALQALSSCEGGRHPGGVLLCALDSGACLKRDQPFLACGGEQRAM